MNKRQWRTAVMVVADDFTGANDAGSGLAAAGARVNVIIDASQQLDLQAADVWVFSTDSRAVSAEEAASRTRQILEGRGVQDGWLVKKIDSTLRGNPGAEIDAALTASGKKLALVVAAVPKLGRITRAGQCYIHGRLLTDTEFASDPKTPVNSADILERLHEQCDRPGARLSLAEVRGSGLLTILRQHRGLLVADAESDDDIRRIMQAAAQLEEKPLLAGASGLTDALAALLRGPQPTYKPLLAVVGSMSEIAQRQIARLATHNTLSLIDIDISQLFQQPAWPLRQQWLQMTVDALAAGKHTLIRTCQFAGQRDEIAALCEQHQISRQQLGEQICQFLGELTEAALQQAAPSALYLSGGDVAIAVARALGATGFTLQGQIAGCVPHGHLLNAWPHLPVLTKAGGFGDENTLVEVIRFIEEKSGE